MLAAGRRDQSKLRTAVPSSVYTSKTVNSFVIAEDRGPFRQMQQFQVSISVFYGGEAADELADSRAVDVVHVRRLSRICMRWSSAIRGLSFATKRSRPRA